MAHNVSNEYKQIIYSGDARNKLKILFNNVEFQDADRYCERLTIKSRILPNGAKRFSLNNFISKEAELILHDIDTSIIKDQISISIGTLVGNSYEYVPIGIFNIQDTPTNDKNKTTIKLRDNSVKFDFNYNAKPLIDAGGGTATKLQILQDICSKAGVTCNISSFIGSTDRVGIYDNTITARQYIADLAEQAGRIPTINRSGELIFVNINSLTTWNIPLSIVEKYELGKAYKIGKVVYEDGVRKYETASTTYDTLFLDASNPYVSSQAQVNSILQQVNSFEIDSVKMGKILGNPAIDGYDLINIYNDKVENNPSIFKTLATNDLVYTGVLINTFDTQIGEDDREQNVSITGEATFKKWAKTEIDNINGEVLIQAGKITTLEDSIDIYSVDLDIYNITIPVDTNNKPLENKTYQIGYYAYYKGSQVTPSVTALSTATGITQTIANNKINLAVSTSTAISNLTNELSYRFNYTADDETYSVTKKIVVVISQKGETGETGPRGETGPQGIQGPAGSDGTSSYFYVRYSANSSGNPMTTTPQSDTQYMGVASTTSSTAPTSPSAYTWSKTKGEQGIQGIQGQTGADGRSSYLHIKYSEDGTTFTPAQEGYPIGEKPSRWQGTYVDFNATDSTTFSDYNWVDTAIMVEDLLTPTSNVSDTFIMVNDSADADLLYFELEGKTTQETRSGKNLLEYPYYHSSSTIQGITYTVNSDGTVILNGTATANSYFYFKNSGSVTYQSNVIFSSGTTNQNVNLIAYNGTTYYINPISEELPTGTYTRFGLYITNGTSLSNVKVYPMIRLTSITDEAWEQYGVSPSPDYPSELVSVGYENLANTLLGTLTNNGITATVESDIITINGTATANSFIYLTPYLSLKSGSYNISVNNKEIIQGTENYIRLTYSSSGTEITSSKAYLNNLDAKKSFTIEERNDYRLQLRTNSGTTYDNFVIKLQLEKGNQTHSYIPYGKYGIEVGVIGKNLFNKDNYLSGYFEGNESTIIASSNRNAVFYIKIDKNTNYNLHLSSYNNLSQIRVGSTDTLPNSGVIVYNVKVFNYTNKNLIYNSGNYNYIVIRIQTNAGYTITPNNINDIITEFQVEKGNVFTDYEEYISNTYLYTLDQPLRSIGDTKDLLYIKNGMLYVDRYIRNLNLAITDMNNGEDYPGWTNLTQLKNDYPGLNSSFTNANISYQSNIGNQRQRYSLNTRSTGTLWFPKSQWNDMTQTDWKTSYPDLVFDFNYALFEPYTEELGTIQIPSTYEGITHLNTIDELEPNMNIIYVRDLPLTNYVESHYAELKINENSIESRVTSIENNGYGDRISAVETKQTSTDLTIDVITQNSGIELTYDSEGKPVSGKVTEVTTTTGFTFNAEGMTIEDTSSNFKAQHRNTGTYYKEGDTIVGQYTKDGSKQKDLELFGVYYYGKNDFPDTPMFVAQLYTDGNGEECFGHFYNRGD